MIFQGTRLKVIFNPIALTAMCIKVLGKSPRCPASHGNPIIMVIKSAFPEKIITHIKNATLLADAYNKKIWFSRQNNDLVLVLEMYKSKQKKDIYPC